MEPVNRARSSLTQLYVRAAQENRRAVAQMMLPSPGGLLVDVGCADGVDSIALRDLIGADRVVGLELADQFIAPARERGVDVRRADITKPWPIESGVVDAVHSNQVIEHLAETDHFMREVRRVLRPTGYAVISTNNLASWHNLAALVIGWQPLPCHVSDEAVVGNPLALEEQRYGERIHRHLRIFTGRALASLAEHHGLMLERSLSSGYYPLGSRPSRLMARLDPMHSAYLVHRYRVGRPIGPGLE